MLPINTNNINHSTNNFFKKELSKVEQVAKYYFNNVKSVDSDQSYLKKRHIIAIVSGVSLTLAGAFIAGTGGMGLMILGVIIIMSAVCFIFKKDNCHYDESQTEDYEMTEFKDYSKNKIDPALPFEENLKNNPTSEVSFADIQECPPYLSVPTEKTFKEAQEDLKINPISQEIVQSTSEVSSADIQECPPYLPAPTEKTFKEACKKAEEDLYGFIDEIHAKHVASRERFNQEFFSQKTAIETKIY